MSTTQQQIEEKIAKRYSTIYDFNGSSKEQIANSFKDAIGEATQPLLERVAELEDVIRREAWLENANKEGSGIQSPYVGWDEYQKLQSQLTTLEAACAELEKQLADKKK